MTVPGQYTILVLVSDCEGNLYLFLIIRRLQAQCFFYLQSLFFRHILFL
jgi:hypothetical protein